MNGKKLIIWAVIPILAIFSTLSLASNKTEQDSIFYKVSIKESSYKQATVSAVFIPKSKSLYMFPGASKLPKRWATFVSDIQVRDSKGKIIELLESDDGGWQLKRLSEQPVNLTYQLNLEHEKYQWSGGVDGAAYARDWGVFYTGRSLFVVNGEERKNIKVEFELPKKWRVATPWNSADDKNKSFIVNNLTELSTSILFAGLHKEVSIKRDSFELLLVLGGGSIIQKEKEFSLLAQGVFEYYTDLMGGIPNPPADNQLSKSVVVINPAKSTDGEALGNNISILLEENGDRMSQTIARFIFAHEFFHLWSGKSFFPQNNDSEWFKEGVSNYYTLKALHHVGYLTDDSYLSLLADFFYQKYTQDNGVGRLSMTDGEEKHAHWGLIYAGGFFVGIAQDMLIRKATSNQKSLDDLMRTLFKKYGGTEQGYTLTELQLELSKLNQSDQSVFFETYIKGVKKLPLVDYLSMAGIDAQFKEEKLILSKNKTPTLSHKKLQQGLFGQQSD
ncbi:M61 family metallopeptidase [Aliikangiella sp. IMCC44359]|uniref:M61 family metallopeptidase n=1 Tax=Aliikangiella sp. IMCC44359 TaxID=3459125 RepID=UPI00403AFC16